MNEIATQLLNALDEYTASCTVALASTDAQVEHGSGVAVMSDCSSLEQSPINALTVWLVQIVWQDEGYGPFSYFIYCPTKS